MSSTGARVNVSSSPKSRRREHQEWTPAHANQALPFRSAQVTCCWNHRVTNAGRMFLGRTYIGGPPRHAAIKPPDSNAAVALFHLARDSRSIIRRCPDLYFGASTMVMVRPSNLGNCSTTASSSTSVAMSLSNSLARSDRAISLPLNITVTLTLSLRSKNFRI